MSWRPLLDPTGPPGSSVKESSFNDIIHSHLWRHQSFWLVGLTAAQTTIRLLFWQSASDFLVGEAWAQTRHSAADCYLLSLIFITSSSEDKQANIRSIDPDGQGWSGFCRFSWYNLNVLKLCHLTSSSDWLSDIMWHELHACCWSVSLIKARKAALVKI